MKYRFALTVSAVSVATILAGCAAPSSTFQNANGQVFECSASGYGILGTTSALLSHSECERRAVEAGYRPVNAQSVNPTQRASNPTSLKLTWPAGWAARDISSEQAQVGLIFNGLDKTRDLAAQVSVISSEGIVDRLAYASSRRANQMGRLANAKGTEIVSTTVNGRDAVRFEVSGSTTSGVPLNYVITIVFGSEQIVYVAAWATPINFAQHQDELVALAERVNGIQ